MTDVALGTMELGSRNRGISLLAGDFNEADRRDNSAGTAVKLKKVGAVTCWDEVGKWPDTHDGGPSTAIDWIVRLKRDRRMKFLDAGTIELESDHDLAWARCGLWVPRRALR